MSSAIPSGGQSEIPEGIWESEGCGTGDDIEFYIYIYINITHKMFSYIYIYILIIEVHVFLQVFNECTTDMDFVVCSVTCYYFFFQCLYVLGESSI